MSCTKDQAVTEDQEMQTMPPTSQAKGLECPFQTDIYADLFDSVLESLPIIIHKDDAMHSVLEVADGNLETHLRRDLDVSRLNKIHGHLWACGRPVNARALHRQLMIGRRPRLTEQCDLHLLYHDDIIYLKPLPAYLLSPKFWTQYIKDDSGLHKDACGLLVSYVWLLRSPLDYTIAGREGLLPHELTWTKWRSIAHEFINHIDTNSLHQVNKRYQFGELRFRRINTFYRLLPRLALRNFVRGYLYGYNRYSVFFQRSFGWILVVFIWFTLILSAMQVGIDLPWLEDKHSFKVACYGFVVFSIVLVAALVAVVAVLFLCVFVFNMFAAIGHAARQARRRNQHRKLRHGAGI